MQSPASSVPRRASVSRFGALAGPALIGAFVLASCGGGEGAATQSTIDLSASSTAFVVRPPATTVAPDTTAAADGVVEGTQEYVVQSGDAPYVLVARFGITLEDLLAVNEWASDSEFAFPGETILLPPGAKSVTAVVETSTDTEAEGETATEGEAEGETETVTIPDAGDNCGQGSYTIVANDFEGKVAANFDVTVDALRAANAGTQNYRSFYPGLVIVIPAKAEC